MHIKVSFSKKTEFSMHRMHAYCMRQVINTLEHIKHDFLIKINSTSLTYVTFISTSIRCSSPFNAALLESVARSTQTVGHKSKKWDIKT